MTTEPALQTHGLARSFGKVHALRGMDMTVHWGRVTALVGPNGAGKTTLLLILSGLLAADGGRARVAGIDPIADPFNTHEAMGWMPDFFGVYDDLTPREYLELFGAAYRMPMEARRKRADELLALVRLDAQADAPVHTLSRGQKQKLGFARTIVHRPRVLLLDEPASGLDPRARLELKELVRGQAESGNAVLISSHILSELEEMADDVVFMEAGRCRGIHRLTELPRSAGPFMWRLRALDPTALANALQARGTAARVARGETVVVEVASEEEAADLVAELVGDGVRIVESAPVSKALEEAFLALEGEAG